MTLQQLLYFREVAEQKSYSKAAEKLYVVQSSLSHAISSLEQEIKAALFIRGPHREVELTDYGHTLLSYADYILNRADDAVWAIEQMKGEAKESVTITFSQMVGVSFVSHLFKGFSSSEENRDIALTFNQSPSETESLYRLYAHEADFIVSHTVRENSRITSLPFSRKPLYVIMSDNHALANRTKLTIEELKGESLLHLGGNKHHYDLLCRLFEKHQLKPSKMITVDTWDSMVANAAIGRGVIITSRKVFDLSIVRQIPLDDAMCDNPVFISYLSSDEMAEGAKRVLEYCLSFREKGA